MIHQRMLPNQPEYDPRGTADGDGGVGMRPVEEQRVRPLIAKLDTPDVAALTEELVHALGQCQVERRLKRMRRASDTERGVYRDRWVTPNHRWWAGLEYLMSLFGGVMPEKIQLTKEAEWVLETALKLKTLVPSMPDEIRSQIAGRLTRADNVAPALLELDMAAHFWQTGREIQWFKSTGVTGQRISEFAALGGPGDLEVECKSRSLDAGRRVIRPAFYRLVDAIYAHLGRHRLCGDVRIELNKSMPVGRPWREQVLASVPREPGEGTSSGPEDCLVSWHLFEGGRVVLPGITSPDGLAAPFLEPFAHVAVFAEADRAGARSPIVIKAVSRAPDRILESIERDVGDAADQLSGARPGVICMYLPDVENLTAIRDSGILEGIAHGVFERRPDRRIAEIRFVVDPVTKYSAMGLSTEYPVLAFINDSLLARTPRPSQM